MREQDSKKAYEKPKNRQKKFFSGLFRYLDTLSRTSITLQYFSNVNKKYHDTCEAKEGCVAKERKQSFYSKHYQ